MPTTKEEKRAVELRENERRKRIVRGNTTPSSSYAPSIASGDGDTERSRISEQDEWWSMDKVEAFYRECCEGREEAPFPGISAVMKVRLLSCAIYSQILELKSFVHFLSHSLSRASLLYIISSRKTQTPVQRAASPRARAIDLSGVQLTFGSASALSDVFAIEWGLRKLVLRECDLDEHVSWYLSASLAISNRHRYRHSNPSSTRS